MEYVPKAAKLSDADLLGLLRTQEDRLPREVVDEILRRGTRLAGGLVALIDDPAAWASDSTAGWAGVHAVFILAAMRPPGGLDAVLRGLEHADAHDLEVVHDLGEELLSAFGSAAVARLAAYARDREKKPYPRIWCLQSLGRLGLEAPDVADVVAKTLRLVAADAFSDGRVRSFAGANLLPFAVPGDRPLLLAAADGAFLSRAGIERALKGDRPQRLPAADWLRFYDPKEIEIRKSRRLKAEAERLQREVRRKKAQIAELTLERNRLERAVLQDELRTKVGRIPGRNDPCICGSGKKYKRCCGP